MRIEKDALGKVAVPDEALYVVYITCARGTHKKQKRISGIR